MKAHTQFKEEIIHRYDPCHAFYNKHLKPKAKPEPKKPKGKKVYNQEELEKYLLKRHKPKIMSKFRKTTMMYLAFLCFVM